MDAISRQQTINALVAETIYTEEELKEYYEANSHRNEWVNGIYESIETVKQLPPIQPEQTNCDYCHEDVDGYVKPIEKNGHAFVRFGMDGWELSLKAKGWHGSAKIMYCPMCGRELKHG